jgi:hypothetical protein
VTIDRNELLAFWSSENVPACDDGMVLADDLIIDQLDNLKKTETPSPEADMSTEKMDQLIAFA